MALATSDRWAYFLREAPPKSDFVKKGNKVSFSPQGVIIPEEMSH